MDIQTAEYNEWGSIIVNGELEVPPSAGNRNYKAIQDWVAEGNTIQPYVAPTAPVDSRTDIQKLEAATGLTKAEIKTALGV